jgi:hypothetical protein
VYRCFRTPLQEGSVGFTYSVMPTASSAGVWRMFEEDGVVGAETEESGERRTFFGGGEAIVVVGGGGGGVGVGGEGWKFRQSRCWV